LQTIIGRKEIQRGALKEVESKTKNGTEGEACLTNNAT
jgi:hypothetical protein